MFCCTQLASYYSCVCWWLISRMVQSLWMMNRWKQATVVFHDAVSNSYRMHHEIACATFEQINPPLYMVMEAVRVHWIRSAQSWKLPRLRIRRSRSYIACVVDSARSYLAPVMDKVVSYLALGLGRAENYLARVVDRAGTSFAHVVISVESYLPPILDKVGSYLARLHDRTGCYYIYILKNGVFPCTCVG
jgi:hypothetical protein